MISTEFQRIVSWKFLLIFIPLFVISFSCEDREGRDSCDRAAGPEACDGSEGREAIEACECSALSLTRTYSILKPAII